KKADFERLNAAAAADYDGFWSGLARETLLWQKPFTKGLDESNAPFYKWFEDGTLNVSYNCLERNLQNGNANKVAIVFEADDGKASKVTYQELYHRVCRFANALKSLGIKKGDRVVVYMPMSIEGVAKQPDTCEPEWLSAEHPLFILYTSGSTGMPKGVQHSSGGYLLWAMLTMRWVFDVKPTDLFWCTADIGWVTGHTYIAYGPLAVGATEVVFEGVPTYPDAGRFWKIIQDHKVNVFYTAPTAIRSLIKASEANPATAPKNYDLSSLRLLGTVGEPINPEAWMWYHTNVGRGRCPIVDTWWQTETGGHLISPLPGVTTTVPGSCTQALPGIMAAIVDETGHEVPNGHGGILVIKRPWPAMIRTIWGDPERYRTSYYPDELGGKLYLAGDGSVRDKETGYFTIMG